MAETTQALKGFESNAEHAEHAEFPLAPAITPSAQVGSATKKTKDLLGQGLERLGVLGVLGV
jgi:hypothetical protein